jgi:hypothetical protein
MEAGDDREFNAAHNATAVSGPEPGNAGLRRSTLSDGSCPSQIDGRRGACSVQS